VDAIREVDLSIRTGEVFGLLGPNGAGKTTLTSLLATLLRPSAGRAEVAGFDVVAHPEEVRRAIGLVFQRSTADLTLTGRENLEIAAGLNGLGPSEARPRIRELIDQMELRASADRRVASYSGGMQRRLEIAVALVHRPSMLFLDEPTLGLDPQGRESFWEFLQSLRKLHPVTILLTTHYLEEADRLCDRLAILDGGRVRALGSPAELKRRLAREVVLLEASAAGPGVVGVLSAVPGVTSVAPEGRGSFRVLGDGGRSIVPPLVRACDQAGVELESLTTRRPTLDEVFFSVTGRTYHEDSGPAARPEAT
jgi:ABC-2 type transport system ATP-binding protein